MASISMKQIAVAMSGGVDSTACALLLKEQYTIHGLLMNIGQPGFARQVEQVGAVADTIGVQFEIVDLRGKFETRVLDYFVSAYGSGKTPNPCMICNREIKCGLLLDHVQAMGMNRLATGHYVKSDVVDGRARLCKGADPLKDQSYFLARLSPAQLGRMMFPLGTMVKEDTYRFVESRGFTGFRGGESQDVCFLADTSVADFLEDRLDSRAACGPIVTTDGTQIGTHSGLYRYTIGQRRGLGLPDHSPWYVRRLDVEENRLVVCKGDELFSSSLQAVDLNWLVEHPPEPGDRFEAKIRSTHRGTPCTLATCTEHEITVAFEEPQRAVTPGQFIVLYDGDRVVGSGEISTSCERPGP